MLQRFTTEVMLITKGHGLGSIRISDDDQLFLNEDIHDLLESRTRQYALGRSGHEVVIEDPANAGFIYRVDLEEGL